MARRVTSCLFQLRASATLAWAETHDIGQQRLGFSEVRPAVLVEQLEGELELVVEGQAAHRVSDSRLVQDHVLHVFESRPGCLWWEHSDSAAQLDARDRRLFERDVRFLCSAAASIASTSRPAAARTSGRCARLTSWRT